MIEAACNLHTTTTVAGIGQTGSLQYVRAFLVLRGIWFDISAGSQHPPSHPRHNNYPRRVKRAPSIVLRAPDAKTSPHALFRRERQQSKRLSHRSAPPLVGIPAPARHIPRTIPECFNRVIVLRVVEGQPLIVCCVNAWPINDYLQTNHTAGSILPTASRTTCGS